LTSQHADQEAPSWGLFAYLDKHETDSGSHEWSFVREATPEEVERTRSAIKDLTDYHTRETFVLVIYNAEEFRRTEQQAINIIENAPRAEWPEPTEIGNALRMDFLNWLLSVRAFLDHTETQLKRRYGKDSGEVKAFKEATAKQFDDCFSYRFLYKLRNYAQHCGFPPLNGRIQFDVDEDPSRWIELFFDKEILLEYDGWGRRLEAEIRRLPEEVDLDDHMDQMMDALTEVAARVREMDFPILRASLTLLDNYWDELGERDGRPCLLLTDSNPEDGFEVLWIPYKGVHGESASDG
jgi:hypothetical protein